MRPHEAVAAAPSSWRRATGTGPRRPPYPASARSLLLIRQQPPHGGFFFIENLDRQTPIDRDGFEEPDAFEVFGVVEDGGSNESSGVRLAGEPLTGNLVRLDGIEPTSHSTDIVEDVVDSVLLAERGGLNRSFGR